jgi:hypothetical protein
LAGWKNGIMEDFHNLTSIIKKLRVGGYFLRDLIFYLLFFLKSYCLFSQYSTIQIPHYNVIPLFPNSFIIDNSLIPPSCSSDIESLPHSRWIKDCLNSKTVT